MSHYQSMRVEIDAEEPFAGQLDELFAEGHTVHIERMSAGILWIRVANRVVTVSAPRAGVLTITHEVDA